MPRLFALNFRSGLVSSGCFRLVNGDVIDLYDRIPVGTKVIVRQKPEL